MHRSTSRECEARVGTGGRRVVAASVAFSALLGMSCTHSAANHQGLDGELRPSEAAGSFYIVRAGDSLWSIAQANGLTVDELAEVNGVNSPDSILPGTRLFLPGVSSAKIPVAPTPPPAAQPPETGEFKKRLSEKQAPFDWPLQHGIILRDFSPSSEIPLDGIWLAAPRGTPVLAAAAGQVLFAGNDNNELGTLVILRHSEEWLTIYGHLEETHLVPGSSVRRGEQIGRVGESGGQETPMLHFQVRSGRQPVDPLQQLSDP